MTVFLCAACATQMPDSDQPPASCPICTDDRQFVPASGQRWTTHPELAAGHAARLEMDGDLFGVGVTPSMSIPQRALLVPRAGGLLWDCTSLVTDEAVVALRRRGGVSAIAISHPHFYSSMVEWSEALGGVPVLLHEADRDWIQRSSPAIDLWSGDRLRLADDVVLIHTPGHFPGSCVLHWSDAPAGRQALLAGDSLHPRLDLTGVSFVHSVPNHVPMHPDRIEGIRDRLRGVEFDDLYGFTWGLNLIGGARAKVDQSFTAFLAAEGHPTR